MKMNEKNKITFKSSEEYYYYEKLGVKNNTVRLIDMKDMRFKKLLFNINLQEDMYIEILKVGCCGKATNDKFIRKIRHICLYENQIIITWGDSLYFFKNIITKLFRKKYKGCLSKIKKKYLVKEKDLIPEMIIPKK